MEEKVFVGVDVSKDSLDVAIGAQKDIITFSNDRKRQFTSTQPALMGFSLILKNNPQKTKNN
jgi:hypothetical protein